jgi:hypothetical protein
MSNPDILLSAKANPLHDSPQTPPKPQMSPPRLIGSPDIIVETPTQPLSASPPVASSYERRELEASMRRQRAASAEAEFEKNLSTGRRLSMDTRSNNSPGIRSGTSGHRRSGARRHSSGAGLSDLRRMEEMMLSEAIRVSLMETKANQQDSTDTAPPRLLPTPPSPEPPIPLPPPTSSHAESEDEEEELLNMAIAMSLEPVTLSETAVADQPSSLTPMVLGGMDSPGGFGGEVPTEMDSDILSAVVAAGFDQSQGELIVTKYGQQLAELSGMGFTDIALNVSLLARYQGRLLRVVNALSDREASSDLITSRTSVDISATEMPLGHLNNEEIDEHGTSEHSVTAPHVPESF